MAQFPAFPLWTDAYLGDTTHLTTIEHGAYLLLLIVAWRSKDGILPDDDKMLARYTKLRVNHWKKMRPIIQSFFVVENGFWVQLRLKDELTAVKRLAQRQKSKAKARWLKNNDSPYAGNDSGICPSDASPTPTPTPNKKSKKSKKSIKENPLPDWMPFDEWKAFLEMRKKIKSSPTDHAKELLIQKLDAFRLSGHNLTEILQQSTMNNYKGLFEVKHDKQLNNDKKTIHDNFSIGAQSFIDGTEQRQY